MKIKVGKQFAIVDDEDEGLVEGLRWSSRRASSLRENYYVYASEAGRTIYMHRVILAPPTNVEVDHINGDGLDNRRQNLRFATRIQNCANISSALNKHGFRGIYFIKDEGKFVGVVRSRKINHHTGRFPTAEGAARARDEIALRLYGEFAVLNFPLATENAA